MDDDYYFFDRSAVDYLWKISWQEFLRLHGKSQWAKGQNTGDGSGSLRGLIAFSIDPEPSASDIEEIIRRRTLRWTVQRSSEQFSMVEDIVYNVPRLRKSCISLNVCPNDFTVLLAAAAEGYFRREVSASEFKAMLKLHYSKFDDFIRLSRQERSAVRHLIDVDQYSRPIYTWQSPLAVLDGAWTGCLGIADTRRFFTLLDRLWKQNPEVGRILDFEGIELYKSDREIHLFRDFGISRQLTNLWSRKVRFFKAPCVVRSWSP